MNEKVVTFNVKYEIVLYAPVFNARCPPPTSKPPCFLCKRAAECMISNLGLCKLLATSVQLFRILENWALTNI